MMFRYTYHLPLIVLVLVALVLSACSANPAAQSPDAPLEQPTAEPTAGVAPTDEPATEPVVAPTVEPLDPTVTPEPPAPTAEPAATPQPQATEEPAAPVDSGDAILPLDAVWVQSENRIIAPGSTAEPFELPLNAGIDMLGELHTSPNGRYIAFYESIGEGRLTVLDSVSERSYDLQAITSAVRFSPDSAQMAFVSGGLDGWQFQVLDLASGELRVVQEGSDTLLFYPLEWTNDGIVVVQQLWFSDAPPWGIFLLDPTDGTTQQLLDGGFLQADPAANITQIALLTGIRVIGEPPETGIEMYDRASGEVTELVPPVDGVFTELHISPNGEQIAYAVVPDYGIAATELHVTSRAGSTQTLAFGADGIPGQFRDLAWRDNTTLLVLVAQGDALHLYELPLVRFEQAALHDLGTAPADTTGRLARIVRVPR